MPWQHNYPKFILLTIRRKQKLLKTEYRQASIIVAQQRANTLYASLLFNTELCDVGQQHHKVALRMEVCRDRGSWLNLMYGENCLVQIWQWFMFIITATDVNQLVWRSMLALLIVVASVGTTRVDKKVCAVAWKKWKSSTSFQWTSCVVSFEEEHYSFILRSFNAPKIIHK